jgi:hypothetical protein
MANEKRLIDVNALELELERTKRISKAHNMSFTVNHVVSCIKNAPTVDAVKVVRCKDCKHWRHIEDGLGDCSHPRFHLDGHPDPTMEMNGFCSCGERREEE